MLLQLQVRKRLVYVAIVITWIALATWVTSIYCMTTDIVQGRCVPMGVSRSYGADKAIIPTGFGFSYLLPLSMMVFCYSRIVYSLKHKVTNRRNRIKFYCVYGSNTTPSQSF